MFTESRPPPRRETLTCEEASEGQYKLGTPTGSFECFIYLTTNKQLSVEVSILRPLYDFSWHIATRSAHRTLHRGTATPTLAVAGLRPRLNERYEAPVAHVLITWTRSPGRTLLTFGAGGAEVVVTNTAFAWVNESSEYS